MRLVCKHNYIYLGHSKRSGGEQLFKCKKCGIYYVFHKYVNIGIKTNDINIDDYVLMVNLKDYFGTDNLEYVSDSYHTFDELYHHRMILFSVICNTYRSCAWKSKLHDDGTMYEDMFIVGISIPNIGDYSYHYHMKDYDEFNVKELDKAPKYDGHKPSDISRLQKLIEIMEIR